MTFIFDQGGAASQNVGGIFRIGHVGDQHAAQLPADLFTGIEGKPVAIRGELARPDERGRQIRPGGGNGLAHRPLGSRLDPEIHGQMRNHAEHG